MPISRKSYARSRKSLCLLAERTDIMLHPHYPLRSFCYWMPYDDVPENFDDVAKEAVYGENEPPEFRPSKGLSLDELLERGRAGTLRIFGCEVFGKAWADEARPVVFEHDGGSELD
jgi:hypothetical protein